MHPRSRAILASAAAATLLGVASCSRASQSPRGGMGAGFRETGTFRFEVRNRTELVTEGWVNVTRDTIVVRATPGPCSYERETSVSTRIIYLCSDRRFSFDRRRPISRAWVTYPQRVVSRSRVCGNQAVDRRGVLSCTRYEVQTVERLVPTSLRVRPLDP